MNYIITTSTDMTSSELIDWLHYYGVPYQRINTDSCEALHTFADLCIGTDACSDIGVVYLRKLALPDMGLPPSAAGKAMGQSLIGEFYQAYLKPLVSRAALPVNNYTAATQLNKYELLLTAQAFGLTIPETLITNSRTVLQDFMRRNGYDVVITKPADEICTLHLEGYICKTFVKKLEAAAVQALPERFFPSLFQQAIGNVLDLKTVYCFGRCYTAAYLQTMDRSTDFRSNYAHVKTLNYQLPEDIEDRLDKLMRHLKLSVCTADFVLAPDGQHYFLEINPFGQFGGISAACNYAIEQKIATEFLSYAS